MYCIKGSKHLYLVDFNEKINLPVWSNIKKDAVISNNYLDMFNIQKFLKENNDIDCEIDCIN